MSAEFSKINLVTQDQKIIAADLYAPINPSKWFILVHMMPATKESWQDFAAEGRRRSYASIAIDLRGHGQSTAGPDGYRNFSDAEHQESIQDLQAAAQYLTKKNISPANIIFVGASIGANLSLQYLIEHPEFKKAALLSAGLDYHGLKTKPFAQRLQPDQKLLLAAAADDERSGGNNVLMNQKLAAVIPETVGRELIVFEKGGHGTELFKAAGGQELLEKIFSL